MDEQILTQTDGQESVVETPNTEQGISGENSQVADVKPIQTAEDNSRFAQVRREAEARGRDLAISEQYGESHGIHTYAEYQQALRQQKQAEDAERLGLDPESIKPFFDSWKQNDPDFQELNTIRAEKNISKALTDLNNELKDNGIELVLKDLSDEEVAKLPNVDKVTEYVKKGHTLADAVFLANKKDFIARQTEKVQQDTVKKITANSISSPGSLTGGISEDAHISFEAFEANKKDQTWVNKNFKKIMESRAKW